METQFPGKLHDMMEYVERQGLEATISWVDDGTAFMVHRPDKLVPVLQMFFEQTKYRSFRRQLNMWYFERIQEGPNKGAFTHPFFIRGKKALCAKMSRHDPPPRAGSSSTMTSSASSTAPTTDASQQNLPSSGHSNQHTRADMLQESAPVDAFVQEEKFDGGAAASADHAVGSCLRDPCTPHGNREAVRELSAAEPLQLHSAASIRNDNGSTGYVAKIPAPSIMPTFNNPDGLPLFDHQARSIRHHSSTTRRQGSNHLGGDLPFDLNESTPAAKKSTGEEGNKAPPATRPSSSEEQEVALDPSRCTISADRLLEPVGDFLDTIFDD